MQSVPRAASCVRPTSSVSTVVKASTWTTARVWRRVGGATLLFISFLDGGGGAASLYVNADFFELPEGLLKVKYVSRVPPSVRPVNGVPRTVSAASSSTCCRTTPAERSVWKGIIPQTENAVAARLTAQCAPKMASVQVRERTEVGFVQKCVERLESVASLHIV